MSIKLLPLLIEIHVLFDVNVCRHLRQMAVQSASRGVVTPFTLHDKMMQIVA